MFSQACVILFTGRGVCLSACWDITPWTRHPPGSRPPQTRHSPGPGTPLGSRPPRDQAPSPGSRHPHNPSPATEYAGRYGQCAGSTHPTGKCNLVFCYAFYIRTKHIYYSVKVLVAGKPVLYCKSSNFYTNIRQSAKIFSHKNAFQ